MTRKNFLSALIKTLPLAVFFSAERIFSELVLDSGKPFVLSRQVRNKSNLAFDHSKFEALMVQTRNYHRINQINSDFYNSGKIISMEKSLNTQGFNTKITFKTRSDYRQYIERTRAVYQDVANLNQDYIILKRAYFT